MTADPDHELQELRRANCDLALERERLLSRIETLKTDYRILSQKYEQAQTELAALALRLRVGEKE